MSEASQALSDVRRSLTAYDLLGYMLPGTLLLASIFAFEWWASHVHTGQGTLHTPVLTVLGGVHDFWPRTSWVLDIIALGVFASVTYVVGHMVASISALVVDRVYVAYAHGYPFRYLLSIEDPGPSNLREYLRGMFFWFNLYMLLRYLGLPGGVAPPDFLPEPLTSLFPNALSASRINIASFIIGWLMVGATVVELVGSSASKWQILPRISSIVRATTLALLRVFSAPARLITRFFGMFLNARRRLDQPTSSVFKERLPKVLGFKPALEESSTYWYAALKVREAPAAIAEPAENFLRLYSFARNLACAFYLAFFYGYVWWFNTYAILEVQNPTDRLTLYVVPLLFWGAFLMLLRYYYIYVDYYTKYLFRAFVMMTRDVVPAQPR